MRKFSGGKALTVAAVVGGAVLASVAPVMADVAAQSPSAAAVRVEPTGKVKSLGAVAEVKVTYACQAGAQAYLNLNLTQATWLGDIARGDAYRELNCTGGFETITLNVTATEKAFRAGNAFGKAELRAYPGQTVRDERTVTLSWF